MGLEINNWDQPDQRKRAALVFSREPTPDKILSLRRNKWKAYLGSLSNRYFGYLSVIQ